MYACVYVYYSCVCVRACVRRRLLNRNFKVTIKYFRLKALYKWKTSVQNLCIYDFKNFLSIKIKVIRVLRLLSECWRAEYQQGNVSIAIDMRVCKRIKL